MIKMLERLSIAAVLLFVTKLICYAAISDQLFIIVNALTKKRLTEFFNEV